ncbi:MAG: hypothetical protein ACOH1N_05290 [Lutibacter sp.]
MKKVKQTTWSVFFILILLAIFSCSSDEIAEIDNADLVGHWNWTNTDGGIGFNIHETPETTGKIIHLNLSKNYTFSLTENGDEILNGTYVLIKKKSIYSGKLERFIQFPENFQYTGIVLKGIIKIDKSNKLEISDNNYDGIGSEFVRIE